MIYYFIIGKKIKKYNDCNIDINLNWIISLYSHEGLILDYEEAHTY